MWFLVMIIVDHESTGAQILKYHVLSGCTTASDLPTKATSVATLSSNSKLSVKNIAPQVSNVDGAGTATVTAADLLVSIPYNPAPPSPRQLSSPRVAGGEETELSPLTQ
jgi:hypothetical protein